MTLSPMVAEWAAAYKQEHGHGPTDTAVRIADKAYNLGIQMAERGCNDKQIGREPLPFSAFESASKAGIVGNTNAAICCANEIAQLLYDNYMIGYNCEKGAVSSDN